MVWFFERGSERLKIETVRDAEREEYLLRIYKADGTQQVEEFQNEATFRIRLKNLERELQAQHWISKGAVPLSGWWWGTNPIDIA